jgi:hypothetical protein
MEQKLIAIQQSGTGTVQPQGGQQVATNAGGIFSL